MLKTQKLFKDFHKKNQLDIISLTQSFIEHDFFVDFPELKNVVAVLITGSVAGGFYDENSDIDLNIIFPDQKTWKKYKFTVLSKFKGEYLEAIRKPIEVHGQNITYIQKIESDLGSWEHDWALRELADAVIVRDPKQRIEKLKEKFAWYPKDVFHEKIYWLFGESSFLLFDRYKVNMSRGCLFFAELTKLQIIRLLVASLALAHRQYPKSDKHLCMDVGKIKEYAQIMKTVEKILLAKNPKIVFGLLCEFRNAVQKVLIGKKLIKKAGEKYWTSMRTRHMVEISTEEE